MVENMDISEVERDRYLRSELAQINEQIHNCERFLCHNKRKIIKKGICLILSFLYLFLCWWVKEFYAVYADFDDWFVQRGYLPFGLMVFCILWLPYNFFRFLGDCGVDFLAKLFLGNAQHSYVHVKQKSIEELARLRARKAIIEEEIQAFITT